MARKQGRRRLSLPKRRTMVIAAVVLVAAVVFVAGSTDAPAPPPTKRRRRWRRSLAKLRKAAKVAVVVTPILAAFYFVNFFWVAMGCTRGHVTSGCWSGDLNAGLWSATLIFGALVYGAWLLIWIVANHPPEPGETLRRTTIEWIVMAGITAVVSVAVHYFMMHEMLSNTPAGLHMLSSGLGLVIGWCLSVTAGFCPAVMPGLNIMYGIWTMADRRRAWRVSKLQVDEPEVYAYQRNGIPSVPFIE